jgi:hypothetical protein
MGTRRWLAAIWLGFVVRLVFYATAFPIWEGFDEWAHFAVIRQVASGRVLVPRDALVPLDIAASMQLAPMPPTLSNLPGAAVSHEKFWALPPEERAAREAQFRAIPREFENELSRIGAYEALQPPVYYWLMAPLLWLLRNCTLATQVFALRWAAVALVSLLVPLLFLLGRAVFRDDRLALGCAAVAALMPELAVTSARVSNEALAIPLYTAATWLAVRRRNWLALGIVLGVGLITKAYFLAALAGVAAAFWAPRAFAVAIAMSGWWYVRNLWTTGTVSGLSEAVTLRKTPVSSFLQTVDSLPWFRALDSILFSHLYFGGWSSLTVRSWMYHLLFLGMLVAALALIPLRKKPEIRSLAYIYLAFWVAQLYNTTLIYATKGVPTSMGWYLYAVIGAEVMLGVAGLRGVLGKWGVGTAAFLFGLLDLYSLNAVALPYYTGLLGRKANGALAAVRLGDVHFGQVFERLTAFKPAYITTGVMAVLWVLYVIATLALIGGAIRLGVSAGKTSANAQTEP